MSHPLSVAGQDLKGTRLDREQPVRCTTCGAHLFDDAPVTGYAYRFSDEPRFTLARLYCTPCDRHRIEHPTLGAHEVLFLSRLDREENSFVLGDVDFLAYSRPTETGQATTDTDLKTDES